MAYAEGVSRNPKPEFCQDDMPHLRGKIVYEILTMSIKVPETEDHSAQDCDSICSEFSNF